MLFMLTEVCENPDILRVIYFVQELLKIVFYLVPILLILMITIDFAKNVIVAKESETSKNLSMIIKRIISAAAIFLMYNIVAFAMNLVSEQGGNNWTKCLANANSDSISKLQVIYDSQKKEVEYNTSSVNLTSGTQKVVSTSGQLAGEEFAKSAKKTWQKIVSGDKNFTYKAVENGSTYYNNIPITNSYCDCSSYVSWALYDFGYEDFKGKQKKTWDFYDMDWNKKYGWKEIKIKANEDISSKVEDGDIIVRVTLGKDGKAGGGHIQIVGSAKKGNVIVFDCGSSSNVSHGTYPNGIPSSFFFSDSRAGKIIRVTKPK